MGITPFLAILILMVAAFFGLGVWVLKRESAGAARAVGYVLIALGIILAAYALLTLLFGAASFTGGETIP